MQTLSNNQHNKVTMSNKFQHQEKMEGNIG